MRDFPRFIAIVVAFMLLGTVAGAFVGWMTAPDPPVIPDGAWRLASDRVTQRIADRYIEMVWRYVDVGMSVGLGLGGALGAASALLSAVGPWRRHPSG